MLFAPPLLKAGMDIRKVSKALGHSSVTITERYYLKRLPAAVSLMREVRWVTV